MTAHLDQQGRSVARMDQGVDPEPGAATRRCPFCGRVIRHAPPGTTCLGDFGWHKDIPRNMEVVMSDPSAGQARNPEKQMVKTPKYSVYQDTEQWIPFLNWFWIRPGEAGMGHGPFPAKWIATLSAWLHNR